MNRWVRLGIVLAVFFIFIFMAVRSVQAAQFTRDGTVTGPIDDDVFVTAKVIEISGPIKGMVVAIGNKITIDGVIEGDVIALGSTVVINSGAEIKGNLFAVCAELDNAGKVGQSVAIAGLDIVFRQTAGVGRNMFFGGYSLNLEQGSVIGIDLLGVSYQLTARGTISRNATFDAGAIEIFGKIGGNAKFDVSAPGEPSFFLSFLPGMPAPLESGIRVDQNAQIGGTLSYTSPVNQNNAIEANTAPIFITPAPQEPKEQATSERPVTVTSTTFFMTWLWAFLRRLITYLILGALALWLLPKLVDKAKEKIESRPLPTTGIGLITIITGLFGLFILPILFVLIGLMIDFISLGGLNLPWFGVIGAFLLFVIVVFIFVVFYGSILIANYALGDFIISKTAPNSNGRRYMAMLVGVSIFVLIRSAPYVGWIFGPIACVVGIGALWLAFLALMRKKKPLKAKAKVQTAQK